MKIAKIAGVLLILLPVCIWTILAIWKPYVFTIGTVILLIMLTIAGVMGASLLFNIKKFLMIAIISLTAISLTSCGVVKHHSCPTNDKYYFIKGKNP